MTRRQRETLALALVFCSLGYEVCVGFELFVVQGLRHSPYAWLHIGIPGALMFVGILIFQTL